MIETIFWDRGARCCTMVPVSAVDSTSCACTQLSGFSIVNFAFLLYSGNNFPHVVTLAFVIARYSGRAC